jgi:hypothetical protein
MAFELIIAARATVLQYAGAIFQRARPLSRQVLRVGIDRFRRRTFEGDAMFMAKFRELGTMKPMRQFKKINATSIVVAFLVIFLGGCVSYQGYGGSTLPDNKVARVTLNTAANIMFGYDVGLRAIDGVSPPKAVDEFTLLPGDHSISVDVFRVSGTGATAHVADLTLSVHVEENKRYVLYWDVPKSQVVFTEP